jgi:menaquinone-specific isochorismate synthase
LGTGALLSEPGEEKIWVGWGPLTRRAAPAASPTTIGLKTIHAELPDGFFLVPDFFLEDPTPLWSFERYSHVSRNALIEALSTRLTEAQGAPLGALDWREAVHTDFQSAFEELFQRFEAGTLAKAVPVITDRAPWPVSWSAAEGRARRLAHWLRNALEYADRAPVYAYGAWNTDENGITEGTLGATPELLIRHHSSSEWSTMALAGTRRDADRATLPSLLGDPKERREHQLVIDGIRLALEKFGTPRINETDELRLPGLSHLRTPVTLESRPETTLMELVRALHPTPALGAFPREAGPEILRLLDERSPIPRRRFGAPFGFAPPAQSSSGSLAVVAIRNLQWDADEIVASAGCGVIAESMPDREWLELRAKLASVRRIFGE